MLCLCLVVSLLPVWPPISVSWYKGSGKQITNYDNPTFGVAVASLIGLDPT